MQQYSAEGKMDFDNDWKIVTMFIGGNDICAACNNDVSSPAICHFNLSFAHKD